jgi:2-polyprenyl-6-hydroxyphenyl methylase/3-demethylubiquinone-9 3-methyltransferase
MSSDPVEWHSRIAHTFDAKYERSPPFIERRRVWSAALERFVGPKHHVLDAGCGTGVLSFIAASRCRSVLGIDASTEMIAICSEKNRRLRTSNLTFSQMRLEQLPQMTKHRFDVIICSSVLEFVPDFWTAINILSSCLARDGLLLFSIPNRRSIYRWIEKASFAMSGTPAYLACVHECPRPPLIARGLAQRGLHVAAADYFASPPLTSGLGTRITHQKYLATLVLYACRRTDARPEALGQPNARAPAAPVPRPSAHRV